MLVEVSWRDNLRGRGYEWSMKKLGNHNDARGERMEELLGGKVLAKMLA